MARDDDFIKSLVAMGVLVFLGYGFYRVLKSFGNLKEGEKVSADKIRDLEDDEKDDDGESSRCEFDPSCGYCFGKVVPCETCGRMVCEFHKIGPFCPADV